MHQTVGAVRSWFVPTAALGDSDARWNVGHEPGEGNNTSDGFVISTLDRLDGAHFKVL